MNTCERCGTWELPNKAAFCQPLYSSSPTEYTKFKETLRFHGPFPQMKSVYFSAFVAVNEVKKVADGNKPIYHRFEVCLKRLLKTAL